MKKCLGIWDYNVMKYALQKFKRLFLYSLPGRYVLRRTACLGNAVSIKAGLNSRINHQKSRVDYLLDIHRNSSLRAQPKLIRKYLKESAKYRCIEDQQYDFFAYNKPKAIVMDSFSELTDQLFVHKKEGWRFLAHYADMEHSPEFTELFHCEGLLPLEMLFQTYDTFFAELFRTYSVKVFFIHFPTHLDKRETFQLRGEEIKRVIDTLAQKYPLLHSLSLEAEDVVAGTADEHPYHFDEKTFDAFQKKIKEVLN